MKSGPAAVKYFYAVPSGGGKATWLLVLGGLAFDVPFQDTVINCRMGFFKTRFLKRGGGR